MTPGSRAGGSRGAARGPAAQVAAAAGRDSVESEERAHCRGLVLVRGFPVRVQRVEHRLRLGLPRVAVVGGPQFTQQFPTLRFQVRAKVYGSLVLRQRPPALRFGPQVLVVVEVSCFHGSNGGTSWRLPGR
ncbi:hypothetical protein GDO81_013630 [Engystomops pustulosus]|uniref:Uncharacterized protein n=1 Tax=Engystomops pustulosus TaxID=76066 RepID=A0AAV7B1R4_ENGPU|nr:hypothetical protein GDO81_013630 [Engystomops pustulosus]